MKITRSTLLSAFARMLDERIDARHPMAESDLLEDWVQTGLRSDDLHRLLEHLYAQDLVDRREVDGECWYQLTARGAIDLRLRRQTVWAHLRDRLLLTRLRSRRGVTHSAIRAGRRW